MYPREYNDNFKQKLEKGFKRTVAYLKLARVEWIVILGVLILDLFSKFLIEKLMYEGQSVTLIPNFLYFTFVYNDKAAFGSAFGLEKILGKLGIRIIFLIITSVALVFFFIFLYKFKRGHILAKLSLALIISGALGNFWDRLFIGEVRDFVEIVYFGLDLPLLGRSFAIFNVADVALTVGVVLFAVYFIFKYKPGKSDFVGPLRAEEKADGEESEGGEERAATEDKEDKTERDFVAEETAVSASEDTIDGQDGEGGQ